MGFIIPNVELNSGLILSNSYSRIDTYSGANKGVVVLDIKLYVSKEAQRTGKAYVQQRFHSFVPEVNDNSDNVIKQGYLDMKEHDSFFADAIDDLDD